MSTLPTLNWKKVLRSSVVTVTNPTAEILDGVWASIEPSVVTYYDGSTRTPGTTGPTVARYQDTGTTEALHWTHPTGDHKSVIAGQNSVTKSPTMRTPDTFAAATIISNVIKAAGAFASWDAAQPFTSGRAFNYWRWAASTVATWTWDIYECTEAWAILFNNTHALMIGAYVDPHSSSLADAESDGRLIGQMTGYSGIGGSFTTISEFLDGNNNNQFGDHHTSASTDHHGVLSPGTSNVVSIDKMAEVYNNGGWDGNSFKTMGGINVAYLGWPFYYSANNFFAGTGRQFGPAPATPGGAVFQSGGVDKAYTWAAASQISAQQCWVLAA